MTLYLMRHGQAASKLVDHEQGLTASGRDEIERLAYFVADKSMRFERIWHSTKMRARQTAEIMAQVIAPDTELKVHKNLAPNDDPELLLHEIGAWTVDTLVVGHLPYMPQLLDMLTANTGSTQAIDFEPGTVVCLDNSSLKGWQIDWVASPSSVSG